MKKTLRITSWIVGSLIALFILATVILTVAVNPNQFKPLIYKTVSQYTQQKFAIEGDIKWSFFPWLGVTVNSIQLDSPSDFTNKNFIKIKRANVRVSLLALLDRKIKINLIQLIGPNVWLQINKQGKNNWQFKQQTSQKMAITPATPISQNKSVAITKKSVSTAGAEPIVSVDEIEIRNGSVNFNNQLTGEKLNVQKFNFQVSNIQRHTDFPVKIHFIIQQGKMAKETEISAKGKVNLDEKNKTYKLVDAKAVITNPDKADTTPIKIKADIAVNLKKQLIDIKKLIIDIDPMELNAKIKIENIFQDLKITGNINAPAFDLIKTLKQQGINLPPFKNTSSLTKIALNSDFYGTMGALKIDNLKLIVDNSTVTGNIQLLKKQSNEINAHLKIDKLNVDDYLIKDTRAYTLSTSSSSLNPISTANAATAKRPTTTSKESVQKILGDLSWTGNISIGKLSISGLKISNLNIPYKIGNNNLNLQPITADLYKGKLQANLKATVTKKGITWQTKNKLSNVSAQPLLNDLVEFNRVSGLLNWQASISGKGLDKITILKSLRGTASFKFSKGTITGINIAHQIQRFENLFSRKKSSNDDPTQKTNFSEISGKLQFNNGIAYNNDLLFISPVLQLSGEGSANLLQQSLDYHILAKILYNGKSTGIMIPLLITGSFDSPHIVPDVSAITKTITPAEGKKVLDQLKDKVMQGLNLALTS